MASRLVSEVFAADNDDDGATDDTAVGALVVYTVDEVKMGRVADKEGVDIKVDIVGTDDEVPLAVVPLLNKVENAAEMGVVAGRVDTVEVDID